MFAFNLFSQSFVFIVNVLWGFVYSADADADEDADFVYSADSV